MNISPKKAFELLSKSNTILLDTRSPEEYKESHIKNSKLIDLTDPSFMKEIHALDKSKTYILYCHTGGRSSYIAQIMLQLGFKDIFNIEGGILNWENQNLPLVK